MGEWSSALCTDRSSSKHEGLRPMATDGAKAQRAEGRAAQKMTSSPWHFCLELKGLHGAGSGSIR